MTSYRMPWMGILAAIGVLSAACGAQASELLGVRFGPKADETRIVFDIQGAPIFTISGDATDKGRLIIDFQDLTVKAADRAYRPGQGHIARYGFSDAGGKIRAVLDFGKTAKIKEAFVLEPSGAVTKHRLVIDLQTADKNAFLASLPNPFADLTAVIEEATKEQPPAATPAVPTPVQKEVAEAAPQGKLVIIIDPGHGGGDPGSHGQSGTLEKFVTLWAANELADILKQRGQYEVVLTRQSDDDPKIKSSQRDELARREELARKAGADLFISLHADAIDQKNVRGGSVYTLSEEGSERSAKIAKSEGNYQAYEIFNEKVGDILLDVTRDETNSASSQLAETLIKNLNGKTPLLNRSHRKSDLRVLLAPDVPAVLFEMAFISNAKDEANLNSKVWRKRTMTAVADAIDEYFAEIGRERLAARRAAGAK